MEIKRDAEVEAAPVQMDGAKDVVKQVLIGPDDGSENIIVRLFTVSPGGYTPCHTHDFEHLVRIIDGQGVYVDADGQEHTLLPGMNVFVPPNEKHQFANNSAAPFAFTCTIPNPESTR